MNFVASKQKGKFKIMIRFLLSENINTEDFAREIFGKMIIIEAKNLGEVIEYTAYSSLFEKVLDGKKIPNYELKVSSDDKSKITVSAEKIFC